MLENSCSTTQVRAGGAFVATVDHQQHAAQRDAALRLRPPRDAGQPTQTSLQAQLFEVGGRNSCEIAEARAFRQQVCVATQPYSPVGKKAMAAR